MVYVNVKTRKRARDGKKTNARVREYGNWGIQRKYVQAIRIQMNVCYERACVHGVHCACVSAHNECIVLWGLSERRAGTNSTWMRERASERDMWKMEKEECIEKSFVYASALLVSSKIISQHYFWTFWIKLKLFRICYLFIFGLRNEPQLCLTCKWSTLVIRVNHIIYADWWWACLSLK